MVGKGPQGISAINAWLDLVRVPPVGHVGPPPRRRVRARRRVDRPRPQARPRARRRPRWSESYLRGFGPATANEIADWAGLPDRRGQGSARRLELRRFRAEDGAELIDLPRLAAARRRDAGAGAAAAGLGRDHARACPPRRSCSPRSTARRSSTRRRRSRSTTFMVDGRVAGGWQLREGQGQARSVRAPRQGGAPRARAGGRAPRRVCRLNGLERRLVGGVLGAVARLGYGRDRRPPRPAEGPLVPRRDDGQRLGAGQDAGDHAAAPAPRPRVVMSMGPRDAAVARRRRPARGDGRASGDRQLQLPQRALRRAGSITTTRTCGRGWCSPRAPTRPAAPRTLQLGHYERETCTQHKPDREHHCVLVFTRLRASTSPIPARLPCELDACHLNLVADAHQERARHGDLIMVGGQRPDGHIPQDRGRINVVRYRDARPADFRARRRRPSTGCDRGCDPTSTAASSTRAASTACATASSSRSARRSRSTSPTCATRCATAPG